MVFFQPSRLGLALHLAKSANISKNSIWVEESRKIHPKADETAQKTKNAFCIWVIIIFCNHQRPGRAKLLKSLNPTVHTYWF